MKKLQLKKEVVTTLQNEQTRQIRGGNGICGTLSPSNHETKDSFTCPPPTPTGGGGGGGDSKGLNCETLELASGFTSCINTDPYEAWSVGNCLPSNGC